MTAAASNSARVLPPAITLLAEVFSSTIRAEVLAYMVPRDGTAYSLTELARALGLAVSSVQHECYKLERLHLISGKREGSSRRYRLASQHPLMPALQRLVLTALGPSAAFEAAMDNCEGLTAAILVDQDGRSPGSVDLILVGDLDFAELPPLQDRVATIFELERHKVGLSFYSAATWQEHQETESALSQRLNARKKLAIWGIPE